MRIKGNVPVAKDILDRLLAVNIDLNHFVNSDVEGLDSTLKTRCSTFQAIRPSNWRSDRPSCRFMKIPKVCAKTFRAIRLVRCQPSRARIFSK